MEKNSYVQYIEKEIAKVQSMSKAYIESGFCLPDVKIQHLMDSIQGLAWLCYSFGLGDFDSSNEHTIEFVESREQMRIKLEKIAAIMEE